jgi:microtubule-associated protein-like 1/2
VGSVVVIYHVDLDHQRHYKEHTNEIRCMDLHPEMDVVVSGQRAGSTPEARAHIRVWKSSSLETISVLGMGECESGISAVAFSVMNKGAFAMAVIEGKENPLSVWDWKKKEVLGRVATNCTSVNGCAFHPLDNNLIISFGKGHLVFWNRRKDGYFDRTDVFRAGSTKSVRCVTFLESGDLVVGDDSGKIGTYTVSNEGDYYMSHEFQAHSDGAVNCLIMLNENTLMSGGEKDRQIISWDVSREFARSGDTKLPDTMGSPRCVVPQKAGQGGLTSNVYVGTSANSIIEGSLQRRFTNVVWGKALSV